MTPVLLLIDTPVPVIDHVTVSFAETDPNAVSPSLIEDNTEEVVILGGSGSTTLTVNVPVVEVLLDGSVAVTVKL